MQPIRTTIVDAHEQSIVLYTAASASEDKEFARFAKLTLPALREHKRLSDVYVKVTAISRWRQRVQRHAGLD